MKRVLTGFLLEASVSAMPSPFSLRLEQFGHLMIYALTRGGQVSTATVFLDSGTDESNLSATL